MNFDCAWPPEVRFQIDLQQRAHVEHLLDDVRVAEELDIRHFDMVRGRRPTPVFGIVVRRGVESGRVPLEARGDCRVALFRTIAETHALSIENVDDARRRLADRGMDWPVSLPMFALFLWISRRTITWIRGRFDVDETWARRIAVSLASLIVSVSILLVGLLWSAAVEIVRLGNAHISYRAGRGLWPQHWPALFVFALVAFLILALADRMLRSRTDSPR